MPTGAREQFASGHWMAVVVPDEAPGLGGLRACVLVHPRGAYRDRTGDHRAPGATATLGFVPRPTGRRRHDSTGSGTSSGTAPRPATGTRTSARTPSAREPEERLAR